MMRDVGDLSLNPHWRTTTRNYIDSDLSTCVQSGGHFLEIDSGFEGLR